MKYSFLLTFPLILWTFTSCSGDSNSNESNISCRDTSLEFFGLGVEIEPWNQVLDSVAGDFKFSLMGSPPTPLFGEFGEATDKGTNVATNFFLKADALVKSPINGRVTRVQFQDEDADYEIIIDVEGCQINYDHIRNTTLSEGDEISVGDTIGNPGPWDPGAGIGVIEIQIQDPGNDNPEFYCPYQFMSEATRSSVEADLSQLMSDIEILTSDSTLYDEAAMVHPGCVTLSEFETEID